MATDYTLGRQPDFNVLAMDKNNDKVLKGTIGVAWKNQDGSIRMKINPFVVLDTRLHDLVLTLFPVTTNWKSKKKDPDPPVGDDRDAFENDAFREKPPY